MSDKEENKKLLEVSRFDSMDNVKLKKTKEGYLEGTTIASRTGVFKYIKPDGSVSRELRLPEEVFSKESMESFQMLPITDGHPDVYVSPENAQDLSRGFTGQEVIKKDSYILTNIKVTDKKLIDKVEKEGKRGVSYGYSCKLVKKDGVHEGEAYNYIQTQIRGNHMAIVNKPRAGHKATLRFDSQEATCNFNNINKNKNMITYNIDGKDHEVSEEVSKKLDSQNDEISKLKTANSDLEKSLDVSKGEKDALKSKYEELSNKDNSEEVSKKVKERLDLEKTANSILKENQDLSEMSDMEIKKEVINKFSKDFKSDGCSDVYITARFDACCDMYKVDSNKENLNVLTKKEDSLDNDSEYDNSHEALLKRNSN